MKVFYAALLERTLSSEFVLSFMNVNDDARQRGYARFALAPMRTDEARNRLVLEFLKVSQQPDDVLVMLDCDHAHPANIVYRLATHQKPVVGALCFSRKKPVKPMYFVRNEKGERVTPTRWKYRLEPCAVVGTGAIAIQRRVFDRLTEAGFQYPYFRYEYLDRQPDYFPTEDIYFGNCCEKAGITHCVDTTLVSPHLRTDGVTEADYKMEAKV